MDKTSNLDIKNRKPTLGLLALFATVIVGAGGGGIAVWAQQRSIAQEVVSVHCTKDLDKAHPTLAGRYVSKRELDGSINKLGGDMREMSGELSRLVQEFREVRGTRPVEESSGDADYRAALHRYLDWLAGVHQRGTGRSIAQ